MWSFFTNVIITLFFTDDELTQLNRKIEDDRKITQLLLEEEKATLARVAALENAIQQKKDETIFLNNAANVMKKRFEVVNNLKDEVCYRYFKFLQNSLLLTSPTLVCNKIKEYPSFRTI